VVAVVLDEVAQLVEVVLHLVVLLQLGVVEAGRQAAPLVAAFAGPNRAPQPLHLLFIFYNQNKKIEDLSNAAL
jgi:hypothetical protein